MGTRFPRAIALMFVLSLIATPQSALLAQEPSVPPAATPVVTEPADDSDVSDPSDSDSTPEAEEPDGDADETQPEVEIPVGTPDSNQPSLESRSSGLAPLNDPVGEFLLIPVDFVDGEFIATLVLDDEFAAEAGDTLTFYYSSDSLSLSPGPHDIPGIPVSVTANDATETLTLTFTSNFVAEPLPGESAMVIDVAFPGTVSFPACLPSETGYTNQAEIILVQNPFPPASIYIDGDECEVSGGAEVTDVFFEQGFESVQIELEVSAAGVTAGTQITISYPEDILEVEPGPVDILRGLDPEVIATAVASDGVITITFQDFDHDNINSFEAIFWMNASVSSAAICDPESGTIPTEAGRLYFVASPGGTYTAELPTSTDEGYENTLLCNPAPASITGVMNDDATRIDWTIDTGDLINGGTVEDLGVFLFSNINCETIDVSPTTENVDVSINCVNSNAFFSVDLNGEGPVRATIRFSTMIDEGTPEDVYVNCASVLANGFNAPVEPGNERTVLTDGGGLGGYVCASVFPPGGGDTVSNVPSSDELYQGDELTYNVTFTTSTFLWFSLSLVDVLPEEGFEVTDLACTFEPVELQAGDCTVQNDNTISVGLNQPFDQADGGPGRITLEITGEVTAAPGTELISEACGERSLDFPGLPSFVFGGSGSGVLCETASIQVLVPTEAISLAVTTEDGGSPEGASYVINEEVADAGVVSFFQAQPPITGTLPASGVVEVGDLPIGGSYTVAISGAPAGYQDASATFEVVEGTGTWEMALQPLPVDPDPTETPTPDPTVTQTPDPTETATPDPIETQTPEPTGTATPDATAPATPGATPTSSADPDPDPTATSGVTGLPETGSSGPSATSAIFVAAIAASILIVAGIGVRIRPRE